MLLFAVALHYILISMPMVLMPRAYKHQYDLILFIENNPSLQRYLAKDTLMLNGKPS